METGMWKDADHTLCIEKLKPKTGLYEKFQLKANNLVKVSEHPWCISCYSLYIDVCKDISKLLPDDLELPLNDKNEFNINDFNRVVADLQKYEGMSLKFLEPILKAIMDCVIARRYHHHSCYKRFEDIYVNKGLLNSDAGHDSFLIRLCQGVSELLEIYKGQLKIVNVGRSKSNQAVRPSLFSQTKYANLLNVCNNIMREDSDENSSIKGKLSQRYERLRSRRSKLTCI
jgi:hypothetical protein